MHAFLFTVMWIDHSAHRPQLAYGAFYLNCGNDSPLASDRSGNCTARRRFQEAHRYGPELVLLEAKLKTMDRTAHIRELNDLYQLMADGRKGYVEASEKAEDPRIKDLLFQLGGRRNELEKRLGQEIRRFKRDDRSQEGTLKGVLHRAWIDIREGLSKSDDASVLEECERGERYLMERMSDVSLDEDVAPESRALVNELRGEVQKDLARVEGLRASIGSVAH